MSSEPTASEIAHANAGYALARAALRGFVWNGPEARFEAAYQRLLENYNGYEFLAQGMIVKFLNFGISGTYAEYRNGLVFEFNLDSQPGIREAWNIGRELALRKPKLAAETERLLSLSCIAFEEYINRFNDIMKKRASGELN